MAFFRRLRIQWLLPGGKYPYVKTGTREELSPWVSKAILRGLTVRIGPDEDGQFWWWDYANGDWKIEDESGHGV